jgi:hypothetical protein
MWSHHHRIYLKVGKVVRECVVSVPAGLDEAVKARLVEAAQAGGKFILFAVSGCYSLQRLLRIRTNPLHLALLHLRYPEKNVF